MAGDPRARYFRRLERLRASARRWSVAAGTFGGAAVVLLPYHGIGAPDAVWAALAGGTTALAAWRWSDARALAATPPPPAAAPADLARQTRERLERLMSRLPGGLAVLTEARRAQDRARLRGLAVAPAWSRLDRASVTLTGLAGRLDGPAGPAMTEAGAAERVLRDLAERTAAVERALHLAPADARDGLAAAHRDLLGHVEEGVQAYERLVSAAAAYVAADGRSGADTSAAGRLTEAADLLRGIAGGLDELRTVGLPAHP
jgi:hypothetical protein